MSENPQEAPASAPVAPAAPMPPASGGAYVQTTPGAPPVYVAVDPNPPTPAAHTALYGPTGTSRMLGVSALIVALVGVIAATLLTSITGFEAARGAVAHAGLNSTYSLEHLSDDEALALLSPVRGLVLWAEIGFWAGALLGIWAIVQGIVATATRRGRGPGVGAIVLAAVGPIVYGVAVTIAVLAGMAVGMQTYS
ncbi:hypothetical protein ITJ43_13975 [Microbacterium sp. VKM Ac-2870]|uniref:hypothetical protein n=1 Tax=Microbacterium sp. VKM Ac-2870 TaxID=2783825 RepID=UPI00188D3300|nr:hypothetical protein [Microbacterium sp. VKM Ac-2870]MBF4563238.1 hypothetical protein [Microbacterium sp. VKM Ac-2870]